MSETITDLINRTNSFEFIDLILTHAKPTVRWTGKSGLSLPDFEGTISVNDIAQKILEMTGSIQSSYFSLEELDVQPFLDKLRHHARALESEIQRSHFITRILTGYRSGSARINLPAIEIVRKISSIEIQFQGGEKSDANDFFNLETLASNIREAKLEISTWGKSTLTHPKLKGKVSLHEIACKLSTIAIERANLCNFTNRERVEGLSSINALTDHFRSADHEVGTRWMHTRILKGLRESNLRYSIEYTGHRTISDYFQSYTQPELNENGITLNVAQNERGESDWYQSTFTKKDANIEGRYLDPALPGYLSPRWVNRGINRFILTKMAIEKLSDCKIVQCEVLPHHSDFVNRLYPNPQFDEMSPDEIKATQAKEDQEREERIYQNT